MIPLSEHGYLIIIERAPGNYGAWAPDLPGCVATGPSVEECEAEMREAIAFHLEGMRLAGEEIPEPSAVAASVVDVAVA
ncbi:MAG: type II toxin-antitoxin system HicB family antitoxin [Acidimicrobiales bacterium]